MIMNYNQDTRIRLRKRMSAAAPLRLISTPADRWIVSHKRYIQRINAFLKHKEVNPNVQEEIPLVCKFSRMVRRHKSQRAAILYRVSANPSADLQ